MMARNKPPKGTKRIRYRRSLGVSEPHDVSGNHAAHLLDSGEAVPFDEDAYQDELRGRMEKSNRQASEIGSASGGKVRRRADRKR